MLFLLGVFTCDFGVDTLLAYNTENVLTLKEYQVHTGVQYLFVVIHVLTKARTYLLFPLLSVD